MDKYTERTLRNLSNVHPILRDKVNLLLAELASEGVSAFVSYGGRTVVEQDALYALGRTKPGKRVTDARGGFSYHNYFVAADILCLDGKGNIIWDGDHHYYTRLGAAAIKYDLAWGFHKNGKHWDKGHVNLRGFSIAQVRQVFQRGGIKQVWEVFEAYYAAKRKPVQVITVKPPATVTVAERSGRLEMPVPSGSVPAQPKPELIALPDINQPSTNEPLFPPAYEGLVKKVLSASIAAVIGSGAVVKNWWEKSQGFLTFPHFGWRDWVILFLVLIIIRFWWKRNMRSVK